MTAMIAEMREALQSVLGADVSEPVLLAGGASKEAWAVDAGGEQLLVRRAAVGVIHKHTLSLADEFAVLEAAYEAGVKAPRPVRYIADLDGREAFVMERLEGETIGRRIVRMDPVPPRLPAQMAEELAKIHAIPRGRLPFLEEARLERMIEELDEVGEARPAIELGLWWLREHRPPPREPVVVHGDYRIGNLVVGPDGLRAVLDWELAHLGDPLEDLGWLCVRAWRFGAEPRVGGFGPVDDLVAAYEAASGTTVDREALAWWEVLGTLKWGIICAVQASTHLTGVVRSVELAAIGRRVCEVEHDLLLLLR
jgi:aminoglycoside phosphotransferase (APT) family kinase protein